MRLTTQWQLRDKTISADYSWPAPTAEDFTRALELIEEALEKGYKVEFSIAETDV